MVCLEKQLHVSMNSKAYILGIDTSNYTTSAAITDGNGNILSDQRMLLDVKSGNKGLRQQDAVFQHIRNLPVLLETVFSDVSGTDIGAICVSSKPRSVEGSYMPCFMAGKSFAAALSHALDVPLFETSHQDGHMAAAAYHVMSEDIGHYVFCHLSGGTCEILDGKTMEILGGSLDISFGQLLDRTGVLLGMKFPCGKALDEMALSAEKQTAVLSGIRCTDGTFNLSGIETQIRKHIACETADDAFVREIFTRITRCLAGAVTQACENAGTKNILFAGGVSSSRFIRQQLGNYMNGYSCFFGQQELCSDNAVGAALVGGRKWQQSP